MPISKRGTLARMTGLLVNHMLATYYISSAIWNKYAGEFEAELFLGNSQII